MTDVRWLIDGYEQWLAAEKVPVVEDAAVDLTAVATGPWDRLGIDATFVHTAARGDLDTVYVLDIPPGGATNPVRHLFEAVFLVLDGRGSVVMDAPDGTRRSFEFGRASLFALPLNARYQFFNSSGNERARLAAVANIPMVMKQFRDADFVFGTGYDFASRWNPPDRAPSDGVFIPTFEMRHMWEAELIPDVLAFDKLVESPNRGAGSANIQFVHGESTMRTHISQVGVGQYKKAHVHAAGANIVQLSGVGYSLYWFEGEKPRKVDWKFGLLHSPADDEWHQHFNVGDKPGRYLPMSFGNFRYPFTQANRRNIQHNYAVKSKIQIEYEDEDPYIRELFEQERARYLEGVANGTIRE
jgi:mannose-6-phosphate isomerase-like protein (cupin superfamily)